MIHVRFAPSPTGMLHIGGARTALINKLFALSQRGQMHLRIEDTDKERSTEDAKHAILRGLEWLGLMPDSKVILQSDNIDSHRRAAESLLAKGAAYYCYESAEILAQKREAATKQGTKYFYDRAWRDKSPADAPHNIAPAIRLKMPLEGVTIIHDRVQGKITLDNRELDDFVILRADGTPTYLLSCVVDDIAMQISHIIRGDDHINNALKQSHLFQMLGAAIPEFGHIPLLHGADGKKFSKRHGAVAVMEYREMGYLPDGLLNYLLTLGWGKGDEKMNLNDAAKIFKLDQLSKSAARFDFDKLNHINALYLREMPTATLLPLVQGFLPAPYEAQNLHGSAYEKGLKSLALRGDTLKAMAAQGMFYLQAPSLPPLDAKAEKALNQQGASQILGALAQAFENLPESLWADIDGDNIIAQAENRAASFREVMTQIAEQEGMSFGKVAQILRASLTATMASPDLTFGAFGFGQGRDFETD